MAALVRVWDDLPGRERVLIGGRTLTLRRSPAGSPAPPPRTPPPGDEHLVARTGEASRAWLACADVIVGGAGSPHGEPARLLDAHPGCLVAVAVTPRGCLLAADGARARLDPVLGGTCTAGLPVDDAALFASAVHAWLVAGGPLGALTRLTLVRGNTVTMVRVRHHRVVRRADRRAAP